MSFLNPLFLIAAAAVAVPLFLHLFRRHESRRIAFPALRYLLRTEREHARRIRFRQILLLLLRVATVLLLVAAGARLFIPGEGDAHDPTALVVILDNSMSSGRVVGDGRVLDVLRARAMETLDRAGPEDRVRVLRAGEPWDVALPGTADEARRKVEATAPTDAAADLGAALARARALVEAEGMPAAEIHLLSDLQRTGFGEEAPGEPPAGDVPVVVWAPDDEVPANHFVREVTVGGGLPPLAGQRTEVSVATGYAAEGAEAAEGADRAEGMEAALDTLLLPLRVVTDERIRAAATATAGDVASLSIGPFQEGRVSGWVETDPDALGADDRRYFTFSVRPAVRVARAGRGSLFLDGALDVLTEAGRIRAAAGADAEVLVSAGGGGLEARGGAAAVVLPPADPALLPALNRRLAAGGIPWQYEGPVGAAPGDAGSGGGAGEARIVENRLPVDLDGLAVARHYRLEPAAGSPPEGSAPVRLSTDDPFVVEGRSAAGAYLLVAAPLDPAWTELPVSASMVPLLEWAIARWGARGGSGRRDVEAGTPLSLPSSATAVEAPDGVRHEIGGGLTFRETGEAGVHLVLAGDSVIDRIAVNPPVRESLPARLPPDELEDWIGPETTAADDAEEWRDEIFRSRQGPELWRPLLLVALLLLLVETWAATAGRSSGRRATEPAGREGRGPTK